MASSSSSSSCPHLEVLRSQPAWAVGLAAVGLLTLLRVGFVVARWVYVCFLRPAKPLRRRYGAWAVVTGASDGIGRAFAFRLAAGGLSLVLVGRNPDKLRDVAAAVRSRSPKVEVVEVVADFAAPDLADEGVRRLERAVAGLDVGLLVNSAGVSYPYARYFHEVDDHLLRTLINVNVDAVTRVTRALLPAMLQRKRGAIVNIGSGAAIVIPSDPLYAVYAATKAYIDQFSRCLYVEYKGKGIDVQCQVPLYVATKMASIRKSSFFVPSADTYTRAAVRWIGYEPRCTPYWPHSLIWGLLSLLPESAIDYWRLGFCLKIRKRGQQKDAQKKAQ
ncbi:very-long-chain 3-oxoacyl-CoA reductase 1-like [Ananas comosus]|uniref:Very-long-chain 3-oxoacyl-CoA reductase 1 n=1 Tax=Ananas comosus TaxID=4615 RepID=A0A199USR6_ANACO|nr:very-long-chain 3-oxoacyl-CoA reductase 1-like [Ananas comosus]OAY67804.1 Very-long-chain 3-oxoacyl-CoA reductase 1 [Ananas comosus]